MVVVVVTLKQRQPMKTMPASQWAALTGSRHQKPLQPECDHFFRGRTNSQKKPQKQDCELM